MFSVGYLKRVSVFGLCFLAKSNVILVKMLSSVLLFVDYVFPYIAFWLRSEPLMAYNWSLNDSFFFNQ